MSFTFADTHNVVAYLNKSDASEGFNQGIDFLNGSYIKFIQLIIPNQLGDLSTRTTKYISPALTQKVFENIRRVGKGCSGVKTPLFEGLLVAGEPKEQGELDEERIESSADTDMEDASNQGRMIAELDRDEGIALIDDEGAEKKVEDAEVADDEEVKGRQADIHEINMEHVVLSIQEDEPKVQEAMEVVTTPKLITEVVTAAIKVVAASTRRRRRVVIRDPKVESTAKVPDETKSKDKGKGIMVEEPKPMKKKQQVKMDEAYARKLHEELNQDINWDVAIDHVKQKSIEDSYEQIKEEENRALESINKTRAQKTARRRKLNEEVKDVKEIKHHLEIVPDEDDVLYTKATPLARKVPVVDYHIIQLNNKPRNKIIRADGTHHLAAKHKLMLLDTATERRLLLVSQVKTVNEKWCC
nr:hypothetical protein [Tanacetum cinerariifolium]